MIPKAQILLLILLWAAPLLAYVSGYLAAALMDLWRSRDPAARLLAALALAACLYAYPSAASKSGGGGETNQPPAGAVSGPYSIPLYFDRSAGRFLPLGADIREVQP